MNEQVKKFFELLNIDINQKPFYHFYTMQNTKKQCFTQASKNISYIFTNYLTNNKQKWRAKNCYFYINEGEIKAEKKEYVTKNGKVFSKVKRVENRTSSARKYFNAFYFDFDLKDKNNNHFTNNLTEQKEMLYNTIISKMPIQATAIVETRNGFHVYFALNNENRKMEEIEWKNTELQILHYMYNNVSNYVDFEVSDASRVLRIPDTFHSKNDSIGNFEIKIKQLNNIKYSLADLKKEFYVTSIEKKQKRAKKCKHSNNVSTNNSVINAIKNLDYEYFNDTIPKIELNQENAAEYIKKYDMIDFLDLNVNLNETFKSILREDNNPSCAIHYYKNVYLYKDFATNKDYDLIHVVVKLAQCTNKQAFKFLCKVFFKSQAICSTDINKNINTFINTNVQLLKTLAENKEFKFLAKTIDTYVQIHAMLKERVELTDVAYTNYKLQCSSEYIANKLNVTRTNVTRYIRILAFCGFLIEVQAFKQKKGMRSVKTYKVANLELRLDNVIKQLNNLHSNYSNVFKCTQKDLDNIITF